MTKPRAQIDRSRNCGGGLRLQTDDVGPEHVFKLQVDVRKLEVVRSRGVAAIAVSNARIPDYHFALRENPVGRAGVLALLIRIKHESTDRKSIVRQAHDVQIKRFDAQLREARLECRNTKPRNSSFDQGQRQIRPIAAARDTNLSQREMRIQTAP